MLHHVFYSYFYFVFDIMYHYYLVFLLLLFLIVLYYSFSANLKSLYLNIKYKYSNTSDHLAVVNEDGLWIKEKSIDNKKIFIINAKNHKINSLERLEITELSNNYKLLNFHYTIFLT